MANIYHDAMKQNFWRHKTVTKINHTFLTSDTFCSSKKSHKTERTHTVMHLADLIWRIMITLYTQPIHIYHSKAMYAEHNGSVYAKRTRLVTGSIRLGVKPTKICAKQRCCDKGSAYHR
eukprot:785808_1